MCVARGGEQDDVLMPALFSVGHDGLVAIQGRLAPDERLMALLDDIYAVGDRPGRTAACTAIQEELTHTDIEVQGKTQLWNRAGFTPAGSEALRAAARVAALLPLCGVEIHTSLWTSKVSRSLEPHWATPDT